MVRNYVRKTKNNTYKHAIIIEAVKDVLVDNKKIAEVAAQYGFKLPALLYHLNKYKDYDFSPVVDEVEEIKKSQKVFPHELELALVNHLLDASDHYVGLTPFDVRKLAYQLAYNNNLRIHKSLTDNEIASKDWLSSFVKRFPELSLRIPEATSIARISEFNQTSVQSFFKNYESVMMKYKFQAKDIYNMDETGLTTVHKPTKVYALKGVKNVGTVTSAERGELITMVATISASGSVIPPMFLFPRVRYNDDMIKGSPVGSIGKSNISGWMLAGTFVEYLSHFVTHARCSKKRPCLLILDNHSSHFSLPAVKYAKENGIIMLTLPPHTTNKLQPLDKTVFGPLKTSYNSSCQTWIVNNPKKAMHITDIPQMIGNIFSSVFTINNILSGFEATGIYPFNRNIFTAKDFAPSTITDRPEPKNPTTSTHSVDQEIPSTSNRTRPSNYIAPAEILPILKIGSMSIETTKRKPRKRAVITDTPEMLELIEQENEKICKKNKKKKIINNQESEEVVPKKKIKKEPKSKKLLKKKEAFQSNQPALPKNNKIRIKKIEDIPLHFADQQVPIKEESVDTAARSESSSKRKRIKNSKLQDYICDI